MATTIAHRPATETRRLGYVFGTLAAAAGLFLINIWPGWEQLSFLTEDTTELLWIVNAALLASTVADLISLAYDPPWLVALGGVVTTGIELIALIRFAQVFPIDFSGWDFDGTVLARVLLILAIVRTAIGIIVQIVALVRSLATGSEKR